MGNTIITGEQSYKCTNYEALTFLSLCILLWKSAHSTPQIICKSHLFVKHIIYLTSFQVVKSHRETTLGSHYRPFIGSRAQHAKELDALRLRSGAGTSKVECRRQPGDQPLCTSSLSRNKVIRSLNTTVLVKSHPKWHAVVARTCFKISGGGAQR